MANSNSKSQTGKGIKDPMWDYYSAYKKIILISRENFAEVFAAFFISLGYYWLIFSVLKILSFPSTIYEISYILSAYTVGIYLFYSIYRHSIENLREEAWKLFYSAAMLGAIIIYIVIFGIGAGIAAESAFYWQSENILLRMAALSFSVLMFMIAYSTLHIAFDRLFFVYSVMLEEIMSGDIGNIWKRFKNVISSLGGHETRKFYTVDVLIYFALLVYPVTLFTIETIPAYLDGFLFFLPAFGTYYLVLHSEAISSTVEI